MFGPLPVQAGHEVVIRDGPGGYLAVPDSSERKPVMPAVVLIHDWWGLNPHMRHLTDQLAHNGFLALSVDLYYGRRPGNITEAQKLMRDLPRDLVMKDLHSALDFLKNYPSGEATKKIAAVGWSMGADWAMLLAGEPSQDLDALILVLGGIVRDRQRLKPVKVPLLGIFADQDPSLPVHEIKSFEFDLNQLHRRAEIIIYSNVRHDFLDPESRHFHAEKSEKAWRQIILFLKANLA